MTLWRTVAGWVQRVVGGTTITSMLLTGSGEGAQTQQYPTEWSMSTLARFPWVWTCVRAVAGDLAGLPLVAVESAPGGSRRAGNRRSVNDPALRLLDNPSSGVTGTLLRKQLLVDYLCSGNAYAWRASESELIRLHPSLVTVMSSGIARTVTSFAVSYWDGTQRIDMVVPPDKMLFIRDVSWQSTPDSVLGESPMRCLHDDLTMELGAKKLAAEQAKRGRPDVLFSTDGNIGDDGVNEVNRRWNEAVVKGNGAFTTGRGLKATVLSWSPREFEYAARSEQVRDTVLAVFEVPPARAGLASANYGTQKQQMRTYWESLQRRAKMFDDAFSLLAAPGVRIEHDFSEVEALQVSYTERQMRVVTWASQGMDPNEAAKYEGFDDVPHMSGAANPQPGLRMPSRPEEPQGDKSLRAGLTAYLLESVSRYRQMADTAESGASEAMLAAWETERLFAVLVDHGIDPAIARMWAPDVVGDTIEASRVGVLAGLDLHDIAAFTADRAKRLSERIAA